MFIAPVQSYQSSFEGCPATLFQSCYQIFLSLLAYPSLDVVPALAEIHHHIPLFTIPLFLPAMFPRPFPYMPNRPIRWIPLFHPGPGIGLPGTKGIDRKRKNIPKQFRLRQGCQVRKAQISARHFGHGFQDGLGPDNRPSHLHNVFVGRIQLVNRASVLLGRGTQSFDDSNNDLLYHWITRAGSHGPLVELKWDGHSIVSLSSRWSYSTPTTTWTRDLNSAEIQSFIGWRASVSKSLYTPPSDSSNMYRRRLDRYTGYWSSRKGWRISGRLAQCLRANSFAPSLLTRVYEQSWFLVTHVWTSPTRFPSRSAKLLEISHLAARILGGPSVLVVENRHRIYREREERLQRLIEPAAVVQYWSHTRSLARIWN